MIDLALKQKVLDELAWQPGFDESDIGVTVRGGFVTLTGHVRSYAEKYAAERAAGRVTGVRAIVDEMEVRYSSGIDHGDADGVGSDIGRRRGRIGWRGRRRGGSLGRRRDNRRD